MSILTKKCSKTYVYVVMGRPQVLRFLIREKLILLGVNIIISTHNMLGDVRVSEGEH